MVTVASCTKSAQIRVEWTEEKLSLSGHFFLVNEGDYGASN